MAHPVIAQSDFPWTNDHVVNFFIILALIMVVVGILVLAWLASMVHRLLAWRRRRHLERRG